MARQRGFPLRTTSKRQTSWGFGPGGTGVKALISSGVSLLGSSLVPVNEGMTVVRTRGQVDLMLNSAVAASDGFQGAVGIGIASMAAVAAGVASVPTPISEQDDENWLWHHFFSVHAADITDFSQAGTYQRIEIDSKGMRKFPEGTSIYAAIEVVMIGTADMDVFFDSRMLLKLS